MIRNEAWWAVQGSSLRPPLMRRALSAVELTARKFGRATRARTGMFLVPNQAGYHYPIARRQILVHPVGFEPTKSRFSADCVYQLRHRCVLELSDVPREARHGVELVPGEGVAPSSSGCRPEILRLN